MIQNRSQKSTFLMYLFIASLCLGLLPLLFLIAYPFPTNPAELYVHPIQVVQFTLCLCWGFLAVLTNGYGIWLLHNRRDFSSRLFVMVLFIVLNGIFLVAFISFIQLRDSEVWNIIIALNLNNLETLILDYNILLVASIYPSVFFLTEWVLDYPLQKNASNRNTIEKLLPEVAFRIPSMDFLERLEFTLMVEEIPQSAVEVNDILKIESGRGLPPNRTISTSGILRI